MTALTMTIHLVLLLTLLLPCILASTSSHRKFGKFVLLPNPVPWNEYRLACNDNGYGTALVSIPQDHDSVLQAVLAANDQTAWVWSVTKENGPTEFFAKTAGYYTVKSDVEGKPELRLVSGVNTINDPTTPRQPLCTSFEDEDVVEPVQDDPLDDIVPTFQDFTPLVSNSNADIRPSFVDFIPINTQRKRNQVVPKPRQSVDSQVRTSSTCTTGTCRSILVLRGSDASKPRSQRIAASSNSDPPAAQKTSISNTNTGNLLKPFRYPPGKSEEEKKRPKKKSVHFDENDELIEVTPSSKEIVEEDLAVELQKLMSDDSWLMDDTEEQNLIPQFTNFGAPSGNTNKNVPSPRKPVVKTVNLSGNSNPIAKAEQASRSNSSNTSKTSSSSEHKILSVKPKQADSQIVWVDFAPKQPKRESQEEQRKSEKSDSTLIRYKTPPPTPKEEEIRSSGIWETYEPIDNGDGTYLYLESAPSFNYDHDHYNNIGYWKHEDSYSQSEQPEQSKSAIISSTSSTVANNSPQSSQIQQQPVSLVAIGKATRSQPGSPLRSSDPNPLATSSLGTSFVDSDSVVSIQSLQQSSASVPKPKEPKDQ